MTALIRNSLSSAVLAMCVALLLTAAGLRSAAAQSDAAAEAAETTIHDWLVALVDGDASAIDAFLAPEFMIARADGSWATADNFTNDLPTLAEVPDISDLSVTTHGGDYIVASYKITASQMLRGKPIEVMAPRLTVLRKSGEDWLLVAHADFAAPPPPE